MCSVWRSLKTYHGKLTHTKSIFYARTLLYYVCFFIIIFFLPAPFLWTWATPLCAVARPPLPAHHAGCKYGGRGPFSWTRSRYSSIAYRDAKERALFSSMSLGRDQVSFRYIPTKNCSHTCSHYTYPLGRWYSKYIIPIVLANVLIVGVILLIVLLV